MCVYHSNTIQIVVVIVFSLCGDTLVVFTQLLEFLLDA